MKRFCQILAASALVVSMLGCSNEPSGEIDSTKVELKLRGDIQSPVSRTLVNVNGFETSDKVGIYVSSTGSLASQGDVINNVAYTYSNGNLLAPSGGEAFWETKDARLSVYAYYPYTQNVSNNSSYEFSVEADQSVEDNFYNSDFITANVVNVEPQDTPVALTFGHSLSKIVVSLVAGSGITEDQLTAADKNFTIGGLVTDGTIDLATGEATKGRATETITPLESNGKDYAAIVYPQSGAVTFYLELAGEIFSYTTNVDFEAGCQYKFDLTINTWDAPQMSLSSTSIDVWDDGDNYSGTMSNTISFSDAALKSTILNCQLFGKDENGDIDMTNVISESIDVNGDGEISYDEAKSVYHLQLMGNISNLSGLECFTNLENLVVTATKVTAIDLSRNTSLMALMLMYNSEVKSLTLSSNPNLTYVQCGGNRVLETLNVSGAASLEELSCDNNAITVLDVSNNPALSTVRLASEGGLQTLYVSNSQNTTGWELPNGVTPTVKANN